ncbi:MAG: response regulator [Flavobacterium sp.]|nr:response regulator [Flavobacterium sp.]
MNKSFNLKIYSKLLFLISGTSLLFFILYISLYIYTIQQEKEVYKTTYNQFDSEVISLFNLNSKTHIATIKDVTYWDGLVKYTQTRNKSWFDDFIVGEFDSYEVDYIGVYGLDNTLIDRIATPKIKTENFISKRFLLYLYKNRLSKFYLKIPEGIVEVFAATIHPSNDPKKNKTNPSGYFIMARLISPSFISNLEKISSSKIELVNANFSKEQDIESVIVPINLYDWKNRIVAKLLFERSFNLDFRSAKKILIIIIIAFILKIVVYLYYSKRWMYSPLKTITSILETGNEDSIDDLKKAPGEFGYIGNLFEENSNQRKQLMIAKQKAEESDKLKSSFLANLSHEIRTPMNAIIGFSDLLNDSKLSEKDKAEYLKIIRNSGTNLVSIIEDLLEMSKIDAKQISPKLISFDLNKTIQDLYDTVKVIIPAEKKINFYVIENPNPTVRNILSDEIKLKQIITNLITNAIKYTENGKVGFGYRINEKEKVLEFTVKDSGIGIDKKNVSIIFDRFRRIEDDFSAELSGLGLGLAICKAYIEMLGGSIQVESTVGVGSNFVFTIPLHYDEKVVVKTEEEIREDFESNSDKVILIAEDDNINFLLLKKILELKNYSTIRAVNGQEAVTICSTNPAIDLVFMDIKMPVMDGYSAFEKIKVFLPNLPVIAQTAHSSSEDKERVMQAGFTDYITKPLDKDKIFELLEKIFRKNS